MTTRTENNGLVVSMNPESLLSVAPANLPTIEYVYRPTVVATYSDPNLNVTVDTDGTLHYSVLASGETAPATIAEFTADSNTAVTKDVTVDLDQSALADGNYTFVAYAVNDYGDESAAIYTLEFTVSALFDVPPGFEILP